MLRALTPGGRTSVMNRDVTVAERREGREISVGGSPSAARAARRAFRLRSAGSRDSCACRWSPNGHRIPAVEAGQSGPAVEVIMNRVCVVLVLALCVAALAPRTVCATAEQGSAGHRRPLSPQRDQRRRAQEVLGGHARRNGDEVREGRGDQVPRRLPVPPRAEADGPGLRHRARSHRLRRPRCAGD